MKQQKTIIKVIMLTAMIAVLTGCWDQHEIDEKAYVIAIGLDEHEAEGKVKVTYLIANPEVGSQQSGGGSNEDPHEIISFIADDFISSRNIANAVISRIISYDLLKVVIISEDLASNQNLIRWLYDAAKDREIKRSANLIVSKETAKQFISKNEPKLETRPHKYFELKIERGQETGVIPDTDLNGFFRVTESDADFFLAIYATTVQEQSSKSKLTDDDLLAGELLAEGTTNVTQFLGSAVFKEGAMIGKISGEETRISSLLDTTWDTRDILTTFQDPFDERYRISARVGQNRQNKYNLIRKHGKPVIEINVPLFIEVMSDPSMSNYLKNKEKVKILKRSMTENVEKKMNAYIERTQQEFKGETFHLSVPIRKEFSTLREFRDFDWMKSYPDAEIRLKVNIDFGEFGRQTKLPSLQDVRD